MHVKSQSFQRVLQTLKHENEMGRVINPIIAWQSDLDTKAGSPRRLRIHDHAPSSNRHS